MCWHQDTNDWTVMRGPQGAHQVLQEQGWGLNLWTNLWPGGPPTALRVNNALTVWSVPKRRLHNEVSQTLWKTLCCE